MGRRENEIKGQPGRLFPGQHQRAEIGEMAVNRVIESVWSNGEDDLYPRIILDEIEDVEQSMAGDKSVHGHQYRPAPRAGVPPT